LIILLIYCEEYVLSRNSILHAPFTSYVFSLNILLSTLLTFTNNLRSSLNVCVVVQIHIKPQKKYTRHCVHFSLSVCT
jgi:hypothetical protein